MIAAAAGLSSCSLIYQNTKVSAMNCYEYHANTLCPGGTEGEAPTECLRGTES